MLHLLQLHILVHTVYRGKSDEEKISGSYLYRYDTYSVFAITAVVNSNYEKESIEKSSKVINNNVEENLDSIYSKSDTEVIINNLESENLGGTGTINRSSIEENTETFYTPQN